MSLPSVPISERVTGMLASNRPTVLGEKATGNPEFWSGTGYRMAKHLVRPLRGPSRPSDAKARLKDKVIWASELGEACLRKQWYKFHLPEMAEPLLGQTVFKFTYGNILEEMALTYVEAAGVEVTQPQALLIEKLPNGWNIRGRIDCVAKPPGEKARIVDVKSCSSFAMDGYLRMGKNLDDLDDTWGYTQQLAFYDNNKEQIGLTESNSEDAEFLFVDKQNGRMKSMGYSSHMFDYRVQVGSPGWAATMADGLKIPDRGFVPVPDAKSGNLKLATQCSYCAFKVKCWPSLRAFAYSTGPKFLVEVNNMPRVPEIPLIEPKKEGDDVPF